MADPLANMPKVNVLIVGASQAGKSSFVSTCFVALLSDWKKARAIDRGAGHSTTTCLKVYAQLGGKITFFDTRGFDYQEEEQKKLLSHLLDGVKRDEHLEFKEGETQENLFPTPDKDNAINQVIYVLNASTLGYKQKLFHAATVMDADTEKTVLGIKEKIDEKTPQQSLIVVVTKTDLSHLQFAQIKEWLKFIGIAENNIFEVRNYTMDQLLKEKNMETTNEEVRERLFPHIRSRQEVNS